MSAADVDSGLTETNPAASPDEAASWTAWRVHRDYEARERLIVTYLPYARALAARLYARRNNTGIEFADYYQWASLGLLQSVDRYDPGLGASFRTFCTRRIEGAVLDGVEHHSDTEEQISLRRQLQRERLESLRDGANQGQTARQQLAELSEIAIGLAIGFMLEDTSMCLVEQEVAGIDTSYTMTAWREAQARLTQAVQQLPKRERMVVVLHYFHALPFMHIAEVSGVSKARVAQWHRRALMQLRTVIEPGAAFSMTG